MSISISEACLIIIAIFTVLIFCVLQWGPF